MARIIPHVKGPSLAIPQLHLGPQYISWHPSSNAAPITPSAMDFRHIFDLPDSDVDDADVTERRVPVCTFTSFSRPLNLMSASLVGDRGTLHRSPDNTRGSGPIGGSYSNREFNSIISQPIQCYPYRPYRPSVKLSYLQVTLTHKLGKMLAIHRLCHDLRSHGCPEPSTLLCKTLVPVAHLRRLPRRYSRFASPGQNSGLFTGPGLLVFPLTKSSAGCSSFNESPAWTTLGLR
jgi:hypothetical protein